MVKFRSAYSKSVRVQHVPSGFSRTRQEFQAECDVNNIMRKFDKTGAAEHLRVHQGRYGDFLNAPDYQEACNQIIAARDMFASLPPKVRKRFDNDPAAFLEFSQNPDNSDELIDMGLARPLPDLEPKVTQPLEEAVEPPAGQSEAVVDGA